MADDVVGDRSCALACKRPSRVFVSRNLISRTFVNPRLFQILVKVLLLKVIELRLAVNSFVGRGVCYLGEDVGEEGTFRRRARKCEAGR